MKMQGQGSIGKLIILVPWSVSVDRAYRSYIIKRTEYNGQCHQSFDRLLRNSLSQRLQLRLFILILFTYFPLLQIVVIFNMFKTISLSLRLGQARLGYNVQKAYWQVNGDAMAVLLVAVRPCNFLTQKCLLIPHIVLPRVCYDTQFTQVNAHPHPIIHTLVEVPLYTGQCEVP